MPGADSRDKRLASTLLAQVTGGEERRLGGCRAQDAVSVAHRSLNILLKVRSRDINKMEGAAGLLKNLVLLGDCRNKLVECILARVDVRDSLHL